MVEFFKLVDSGAITLPRRKVVIDPYYWYDDNLISHELCHVEQYERLGVFNFLVKYFIGYIRYGYDKHPMEIEARNHETKD